VATGTQLAAMNGGDVFMWRSSSVSPASGPSHRLLMSDLHLREWKPYETRQQRFQLFWTIQPGRVAGSAACTPARRRSRPALRARRPGEGSNAYLSRLVRRWKVSCAMPCSMAISSLQPNTLIIPRPNAYKWGWRYRFPE